MLIAGLDVETTSKLSPEHRIIELCVQKWEFNTDTKAAIKRAQETWRFNPERSIDPKAYAVHKISLDDLVGEPTFEAALPQVLDFMEGVDLFVAHNGDEFDRPFLRMEVERVASHKLHRIDGQQWFDTMQEGRWAHPWGKVPTLRELCWACDVAYDPTKSHAADYDVEVMMRAFFFAVRAGFFNPFPSTKTLAA